MTHGFAQKAETNYEPFDEKVPGAKGNRTLTQPHVLPRNLQADAGARIGLAARCESLHGILAALPAAGQCALLVDTRPLHRSLFGDMAPDIAGLYRGTPGTPVANAARAVFLARRHPGLRARDLCAGPLAVGPAMDALGTRIAGLWATPPTGDAAFDALAGVTRDFLTTHPYVDGNGHVYRLLATILAPRLGLSARPDFTLHPRPYDHLMSLCLQWYPDHPGLLSAYLRRWFTG